MHQKSKLAIILLTISTPVLAAVYLAWNNKASKNVELTYDQAIKIEDQDRNVLSNSLAIKERKVLEKAQAALQESQNPIIKETSVNTGSTVFASLKEIGISATEASLIIEAAKPEQDLGSIKSGSRIISESSKDQSGIEEVKKVTFYLEKTSYLEIVKQKDSWQAKVFSLPLTVTNELVSGVVQSSLWDSAMSAGLDSQAIQNLTDIFGWQIDFERQVKPGDEWQILVESVSIAGRWDHWGRVLSAKYRSGSDTYQAYLFNNDGHDEYYDQTGASLKGKFLKSPLNYTRISSKFQKKRFHPILGINRPHNGVDYAAATGTAVRAVGDGVITIIGTRGGSGKMIEISHNDKYRTAYKHLNSFTKGLRVGSRIKQGQVIAGVGSTGLATGPHLHFEFYENNRFVDPLGKKFPRENSLMPQQMANFNLEIERINHLVDEKAIALAKK